MEDVQSEHPGIGSGAVDRAQHRVNLFLQKESIEPASFSWASGSDSFFDRRRGDYLHRHVDSGGAPSPSTQQITFMVFNPGYIYRCGLRVAETSTASSSVSAMAAVLPGRSDDRLQLVHNSIPAFLTGPYHIALLQEWDLQEGEAPKGRGANKGEAPKGRGANKGKSKGRGANKGEVPKGRGANKGKSKGRGANKGKSKGSSYSFDDETAERRAGQREVDRHFSTFKVGITASRIHSGCALAVSGGGESLVTILEDRITQSPWATASKPGRWALAYLLARIDFGTLSDGSRRTRAGFNDIAVCSVHMNNKYAKSADVCVAVLTEMFQRCLESRALFIGGDFNASAYPRGTEPSLAVKALEAAIELAGTACRYHVRVEDCIVGFVIQYQRYVSQYKVSKSNLSSTTNEDLRLFPLDTDWHLPLMVTIRPLNDSVSSRQRSAEGEKDRKAAKRTKYRERHAEDNVICTSSAAGHAMAAVPMPWPHAMAAVPNPMAAVPTPLGKAPPGPHAMAAVPTPWPHAMAAVPNPMAAVPNPMVAVPNPTAVVPNPMAAAANIKPPPPNVPKAGVTTAAVPPPMAAVATPAAPQAAASSASAASPDPPWWTTSVWSDSWGAWY